MTQAPPAPPKTKPPPPPNGKPPTTSPKAGPRPTLGKLEPVFKPPRIVLNAVEGWGKTSAGAFAPEAAILMAKGETGYETLLGANLVPSIDAAKLDTWQGTLDLLDELAATDDLGYKTLCLDAMGGFERLCHEHVCTREYRGEWGETGFTSYQKGYDVSVTDWLMLLRRLDALQDKGVAILLLSHCQIRAFKNPLGEDYDRYVSDVHHKTWAPTHKWADAVLFGNFLTIVDKATTPKKGKGKGIGIGGTERILYCQHRDAFDAKNRYRMPDELDIPDKPSQIWPTIWNAIQRKEQ